MAEITVRTRQHRAVEEILMRDGRYVTDSRYVAGDGSEFRSVMLKSYDWLAKAMAERIPRPSDASYPVWVTIGAGEGYPAEGGVIFVLSVPEEQLLRLSTDGWSAVLDYRYIPKDDADAARHRELLELYGASDAKAVMTSFYPQIKREIVESWPRAFASPDHVGTSYGLIWEIRKEWVREVIK